MYYKNLYSTFLIDSRLAGWVQCSLWKTPIWYYLLFLSFSILLCGGSFWIHIQMYSTVPDWYPMDRNQSVESISLYICLMLARRISMLVGVSLKTTKKRKAEKIEMSIDIRFSYERISCIGSVLNHSYWFERGKSLTTRLFWF